MDRSKRTMTKDLGDEKTHKTINNQFYKRLNIVAKNFYAVELLTKKKKNKWMHLFSGWLGRRRFKRKAKHGLSRQY